MKRLILPAIVLLTAGLAAFLWWSSGSKTPSALTAAQPGEPAAGDGAPAGELAASETLEQTEASGGAESAERRDAREDQRLAAERDATWIEGRVRPPEGCAIDETLEVFAFRSKPASNELTALSSPSGRPDFGDRLLDRRSVARDGTFRVPVPPAAESVHLTLLGRTLYLDESVAVDLAEASRGQVIELVPQCGAWIHGSVIAPEGESKIANVTLHLNTKFQGMRGGIRGMNFTRRLGEPAADGTYEFRGVPPGGPFVLQVDSKRFACTQSEVPTVAAGEDRKVDVHLSAGGSLSGRVVDESKAPIADATVEAQGRGIWFGFDNRTLREAKTAADGTFELAAVAPGKVILHAEAQGFLEADGAEVELAEGAANKSDDIVLTSGASVAGRVTWPDGKAAGGIEVEVRFDVSQMYGMSAFNARTGSNGETKTNEDGTFRVTGLGKGPFTVRAEAEPEGGSVEWKARADGVQPGTSGLELVLTEPIGLAGRVVQQDGAPVKKFEITAHQLGGGLLGSFGQDEEEEEFESEEGKFLLGGLHPGKWRVFAVADGFGVPEPVEAELPQPAGGELLLTLYRAGTVAGFVRSPEGKPVAGARVAVDRGGPGWQEYLPEEVELPDAETGSDGAFLLGGLAAGEIGVRATAKDFARSETLTVTLEAGQALEGVELELRIGGTLTGEVYGKDGKPSAGRFVQVTQMESFDTQIVFTQADGTFRIEHLQPGTWQTVAMASQGDASSRSDEDESDTDDVLSGFSDMKIAVAELKDGEETHVVLGAPPANPVRVHGKVTHDGAPYTGAIVTFYAEGANSMQSMRNTQIGSEGSYSVELDAPGSYVVQIQKIDATGMQQRIVEFARTIPEGEDQELDFEIPTGRISGRVEGPDGAPAVGARVSLHPQGALETGTLWGGQYSESATDAEGRFDIQGLRPGTYSLLVGGMTFAGLVDDEARFGREARTVHVREGEWLDRQDFRMKRPGKIEARVVDAAGHPVSEAAVFVRDADGHLLDRLSMTMTGPNGVASYGGLGPGAYTVCARKGTEASPETSPVRVSEDETQEVRVVLETGTVLLVTLQGDEGELLSVHVSVEDADGREVSGLIALSEIMAVFSKGFSTKEHRVGPLPPGKYTVTATTKDGKTIKKPVTLTGKTERRLTLKFD